MRAALFKGHRDHVSQHSLTHILLLDDHDEDDDDDDGAAQDGNDDVNDEEAKYDTQGT